MNDAFSRFRRSASEFLSILRPKSAEQKHHEAGIHRAIERVVEQVNPRLRAVSGYRRRLFPVVEATLGYARQLARQVPGPLVVDRQSWAVDPKVNAMFGSVDRLRRVLSSPEVRTHVKNDPLGGECFALLASMPDVRNQLGMELAGESVQRDVRQTTVSFSDHEVAVVCAGEDEARKRLADLAHEVLVAIAVEDILSRESRIVELEDRLRIVRIKSRVADASARGASIMTEGSAPHVKEIEELRTRATQLERELAEARSGIEGLDGYLACLVAKLEQPDSHLSLKEVEVRLDRMNIVREGAGDTSGTKISFCRVQRSGQPARVVHLIRFPRSEILDDEQRLQGLQAYLS